MNEGAQERKSDGGCEEEHGGILRNALWRLMSRLCFCDSGSLKSNMIYKLVGDTVGTRVCYYEKVVYEITYIQI